MISSVPRGAIPHWLIILFVKDVEPKMIGRIQEPRRPAPLCFERVHLLEQIVWQPLDGQVLFHVLPLNGLGHNRDTSLDGPGKTNLVVDMVSAISLGGVVWIDLPGQVSWMCVLPLVRPEMGDGQLSSVIVCFCPLAVASDVGKG